MSNLVDELIQKQAPKFQVNDVSRDKNVIDKTLLKNDEGIFNLNSKIDDLSVEALMIYFKQSYQKCYFELNKTPTNYEIMFKKKEVKN